MSESINVNRLSTRDVRRIIITAGVTPPREPTLSELFSVLLYRADRNPVPVIQDAPDTQNPTCGDNGMVYATLFSIPRLIPMLKACQDGSAPPGAISAFQHDLDRIISGLMHWNPEGMRSVLWLKERIIKSFEPEAVERFFRSYLFKLDPLLHDNVQFRSLLKLPLRSTESIPFIKSFRYAP